MATAPYTGPDRRKSDRAMGWHSTTFGLVLGRLWSLIAYSDTTPTRFMLGLAGACWSLLLFAPGDTFNRPVYRYMALLGPENIWAALWAVYSGLMFWRVFSSSKKPTWSIVVNTLGMMLYWCTTVSIYLTLTYPLPAALAVDVVLSLSAAWVLIRTNINPEGGWRRD